MSALNTQDTLKAARKASGRSVALSKVYDPNQPRNDDGEWARTRGGLGNAQHYRGDVALETLDTMHLKFPHAPSNQEKAVQAELTRAIAHKAALARGGVDPTDSDMTEAVRNVNTLQNKLKDLQANRNAEKLKAMQSGASFSSGQAQHKPADQRTEIERLLAAGQQRRVEYARTQFSPGPGSGPRPYVSNQQEDIASDSNYTKPGPGLRRAAFDATARAARASRQVSNLLGNLHGITATSDYARVGAHLNYIHNDLSILHSELRHLPKDLKVLGTEVSAALGRAQAASKKLGVKLKAAMSRKKKAK